MGTLFAFLVFDNWNISGPYIGKKTIFIITYKEVFLRKSSPRGKSSKFWWLIFVDFLSANSLNRMQLQKDDPKLKLFSLKY